MKKLKWILIGLLLLLGATYLHTSSLIGVSLKSKKYLSELKTLLRENGHRASLFVISGRRWWLDNYILNKFGNASSKSRHKRGEAIDIIVLDVNKDGKMNADDVDIVYQLLNQKIIKGKGGIGTYKRESGFFNRQMVHFDCRGHRARWHR